MAPKQKGGDVNAGDLTLREQERIDLNWQKKVKDGMKYNIGLAAKLARHAAVLGYDLDDAPAAGSSARPQSYQKRAQDARLAALKASSHAAAKQEMAKESNGLLHEKYQKIEDFSVTMLREDC